MREALLHFPAPWLTVIGLLLFLTVFCGQMWLVFRKSAAGTYQQIEQMPLLDEITNK